MRIAHIAPVATTIPPPKSGSVETMTSLLTEGLVARGHDVTLFATGDSKTAATLHAIYPHGYWHDETMWPWELYEMLNLAAAVERASEFDVIHYEAAYYPMSLAFTRLSRTPILQTLHHSPSAAEVTLWSHYPEAPFVAISNEQARLLNGLNVVETVLHGIDTDNFTFREKPDDYLLFLGRFTEGKGVLQAIEIAKRTGIRLILAAAEDDYYREHVAPHVDGRHIVYYGEADFDAKVKLYGGARALLYPIQSREPFGLVLAAKSSTKE
jgi:glycosyltransferase involved in cell wall biosynthesis